MPRLKKSSNPEKVPNEMQPLFKEMALQLSDFCTEHLSDEYGAMIRKLAAALCRKRPSPLHQGHLSTWLAAMTHAICTNNFAFDRSQTPSLQSPTIAQYFGVAQSTMSNKSKSIREMLKINQSNPNWVLPSRMGDHPWIWTVMVDDLVVDARYLPLHLQMKACERGLIPYVPGLETA